MPNWSIHKKWDLELGIPSKVSDYIQKAIDSKGPSDKNIIMPKDFVKHCEEKKIIWSGHKDLAIVDLAYNLHDRARDKVIQAEDLKFLLKKGTDYVKAYYLHFILDYLFYFAFKMTLIQDQLVRLFNASLSDAMLASPFSA